MSSDNNNVSIEGGDLRISLPRIAKMGQDLLVISTLLGFVIGPLWYFNVSQPIGSLKKQVERIQVEMSAREQKVSIIDKNVAVILERTQRQEESLNSIRRFLENGKK